MHQHRIPLLRAHFFLQKSKECPATARFEFEAYLEAAIVFARSAMHRIQTQYGSHPEWADWWKSLETDPAVTFFREQRNCILKERQADFGEKLFLASTENPQEPYVPTQASEFYFFESPSIPATDTVERHLQTLKQHFQQAELLFT